MGLVKASAVEYEAGGTLGLEARLAGVEAGTGLASDAVTYAKMQNVTAAERLLGRGAGASGDVQELVLGTNLSFSGTTLNAAGGGGTPATTVQAETAFGVAAAARRRGP